jgi:hypothetical protein
VKSANLPPWALRGLTQKVRETGEALLLLADGIDEAAKNNSPGSKSFNFVPSPRCSKFAKRAA